MKNVVVFLSHLTLDKLRSSVDSNVSWVNYPCDRPLEEMLPSLAGEHYDVFPEQEGIEERRHITALLVQDGQVVREIRWLKISQDGEWERVIPTPREA